MGRHSNHAPARAHTLRTVRRIMLASSARGVAGAFVRAIVPLPPLRSAGSFRRNSMRYLNRPLLAAMFFACAPGAFAQAPAPGILIRKAPRCCFARAGCNPRCQTGRPGRWHRRCGHAAHGRQFASRSGQQAARTACVREGRLPRPHSAALWAERPLDRDGDHTGGHDPAGQVQLSRPDRLGARALDHPHQLGVFPTPSSSSRTAPTSSLAAPSRLAASSSRIELSFNDLKWFKLDPEKVVPGPEVKNPDLTKVDEIGMAYLAPGGGHGTANSINLSDVEVYAKPVPR